MNTIKYTQWNNSKLQKSAPFRKALINITSNLGKVEVIKILLAEKFCENIGMILNQTIDNNNPLVSDLKERLKHEAQKCQHICFTTNLVLAYMAYINKQYDNSMKLLNSNKNICHQMIKIGYHYYNFREIIVYVNQFQILFCLNDREGYLQIERLILKKLGIIEISQKDLEPNLDQLQDNKSFLYAFCIYDTISKIIKNYNERSEISRFAKQIHIDLEYYSSDVFQNLYSFINIVKQLHYINQEEFSLLSRKHLALSSEYFGGMLEDILINLNKEYY